MFCVLPESENHYENKSVRTKVELLEKRVLLNPAAWNRHVSSGRHGGPPRIGLAAVHGPDQATDRRARVPGLASRCKDSSVSSRSPGRKECHKWRWQNSERTRCA